MILDVLIFSLDYIELIYILLIQNSFQLWEQSLSTLSFQFASIHLDAAEAAAAAAGGRGEGVNALGMTHDERYTGVNAHVERTLEDAAFTHAGVLGLQLRVIHALSLSKVIIAEYCKAVCETILYFCVNTNIVPVMVLVLMLSWNETCI